MQNDVILKGSQQRIFNNEHYILIACFYQKRLRQAQYDTATK